jgi:type VI secretion system protein ImpK
MTSDPTRTDASWLSVQGLPDDARLASSQFRVFYAELCRVRVAALSCKDATRTDIAELSERLVQVIELQSLESQRLMGLGGQSLETRARFLKAALADEVMLHLEWSGRALWRDQLIEARLFRTSRAGDQVVDDIEALLSRREGPDRASALLLLHALSLGFQGRLRGRPDATAELQGYRTGLFRLVYQRDPNLELSAPLISSAAYDHTLTQRPVTRLPRLSRRGVYFTLVMVALLLISQGLWLWQTWPLRRALDQAAERSQAMATPTGMTSTATAAAEGRQR